MIIDSSALVAIALEEPDYRLYQNAILQARVKRMSAASWMETHTVLIRRKGALGVALMRSFLADARVEIVPFTPEQGEVAFEAYRRYGKGLGHPAQLNILDCCAYALARVTNEPLLFKGQDFGHTDIAAAV